MPRSVRRPVLCACGHDRDAHRHFRPGSDCGLCTCSRWTLDHWLRRILRKYAA
ncbi:MAG TPA: hypothetical protein VGS19_30080 [Streptosporangiaceae bacterium]|nr:hypothetical protein [Streptosporangiaceae bacterium]